VRVSTSTAPSAQTRSLATRYRAPGEPDEIADLSDTIVVPAAVQLDRELGGRAIEIQYVAVQRMLTTKFVACKISVPEMRPENAFSVGCLLSQQTSALHEVVL
jgi:hypothetical protein